MFLLLRNEIGRTIFSEVPGGTVDSRTTKLPSFTTSLTLLDAFSTKVKSGFLFSVVGVGTEIINASAGTGSVLKLIFPTASLKKYGQTRSSTLYFPFAKKFTY